MTERWFVDNRDIWEKDESGTQTVGAFIVTPELTLIQGLRFEHLVDFQKLSKNPVNFFVVVFNNTRLFRGLWDSQEIKVNHSKLKLSQPMITDKNMEFKLFSTQYFSP